MSPLTPESRHHAVVLGPPGGAWPDAAFFAAWCAAHRGAQCTLWLAGALTRSLLADAAASFPDAPALAGWARRVLADYEDAAEPDGAVVATWRTGAGGGGRSGACVLDAGFDLAACRAAAAEHGVRILGIHPLWAGALALLEQEPRGRVALQAEGALLVVDGVQTTVLRWRAGALIDLQQRWLARPEADELDALATEVSSGVHADLPADAIAIAGRAAPLFALGHGLAGTPGALVQVLGRLGQDAAGLRDRLPRQLAAPDFARPPAVLLRPWAQRAFAATAAVVLALAVHDAWSVHGSSATPVAAPDAALLALPRDSATQVTASADALAAAGPRASLQAAGSRLQHPWPQLFAAVEGTALDGEWLVLEHRAQQSTFRLGGVASSTTQAMATARALAAADGVADAFVSRAEPGAAGGLAFDITGHLDWPRATAGALR